MHDRRSSRRRSPALAALALAGALCALCVSSAAAAPPPPPTLHYVTLPGNAAEIDETARTAGAGTLSFTDASFGTNKVNFSLKNDPTNGVGELLGVVSPEPPYVKVRPAGGARTQARADAAPRAPLAPHSRLR